MTFALRRLLVRPHRVVLAVGDDHRTAPERAAEELEVALFADDRVAAELARDRDDAARLGASLHRGPADLAEARDQLMVGESAAITDHPRDHRHAGRTAARASVEAFGAPFRSALVDVRRGLLIGLAPPPQPSWARASVPRPEELHLSVIDEGVA